MHGETAAVVGDNPFSAVVVELAKDATQPFGVGGVG